MYQQSTNFLLKSLLFLCLIFSCFSYSFSQTYTGPQEDIDQILANIKQFSAYVMAGQAKEIAECYTEDGKIFPNRRRIMEGQEALQRYWEPSEGYQTTHHKITPSEIKIIGDEAYDYGYYKGASKNPEGEESNWGGKYVIVWKKVEGEWKIYLDIWNSVVE